jgi:acetoin:2,6-dichlorophenolindophenol oxidoreductase subunit beta
MRAPQRTGSGRRVRTLSFEQAAEAALDHAMTLDPRVVVFGEDVRLLRRNLLVRHGPSRVLDTPISESAFLGAAVGAAMAGLRPVVELYMVDFLAVAFDALLNHAAKFEAFSGGRWRVPLVLRAPCGGWYGDGGQHGQALWGLLGGIPGLRVVVPSNPADAAGLLLTAIEDDGPVVFMEPKLLTDTLLDALAGARRDTVRLDVPAAGHAGPVADPPAPVPFGVAARRREGRDVALVSVGVGVHRCLEAAADLAVEGIDATVLDLRSIAPLDHAAIVEAAEATGHVLVVDEDHLRGGLSAEIGAVLLERGVDVRFARVTTETTLPFSARLERETLPNPSRIVDATRQLVVGSPAPTVTLEASLPLPVRRQ